MGLAITMSSMTVAPTVRAREVGSTTSATEVEPSESAASEEPVAPLVTPDVLRLTSDVLALKVPAQLEAARARALLPSAHQGTEIRLSSGAKTAIIVTAIVVGVLILVFAVGRPHRHW
jgi:hypothetical protein